MIGLRVFACHRNVFGPGCQAPIFSVRSQKVNGRAEGIPIQLFAVRGAPAFRDPNLQLSRNIPGLTLQPWRRSLGCNRKDLDDLVFEDIGLRVWFKPHPLHAQKLAELGPFQGVAGNPCFNGADGVRYIPDTGTVDIALGNPPRCRLFGWCRSGEQDRGNNSQYKPGKRPPTEMEIFLFHSLSINSSVGSISLPSL